MNCRTFSQNPRTQGKSHHMRFTTKVLPLGDVGLICSASKIQLILNHIAYNWPSIDRKVKSSSPLRACVYLSLIHI